MSLEQSLNNVKEDIKLNVKDAKVVKEATTAIDQQWEKIKYYVSELKRKGMESKVGQFIAVCIANIKSMLSKLLGHIKDLWARICAMFNTTESKQLSMNV
jgi:Na+/phosphate symporter